MKGSLLWKLMYLFCGLAGVLAGYGIFTLTGAEDIQPNINTKDNTLTRETEESVFFDETEETPVTEAPDRAAEPTELILPSMAPEPAEPVKVHRDKPELPVAAVPTKEQGTVTLPEEEPLVTIQPEDTEERMPSLASQWVLHEAPEVSGNLSSEPVSAVEVPEEVLPEEVLPQSPVEEAITYPVKIFGQVPVINRSDTYVSYFEFSYDLIEMLEPQVKQRGLNINVLLTRFVVKALFCGVDIEKLDINAPIPRRQAALCLWLAAQLLNESGTETSAKAAQQYVTDIGGCSLAEKKAVAYLYEQSIFRGQQFYPDSGLKTESGTTWLSRVKQCWN